MIEKVTLLFPGQGSQYVGMGKALHGGRGQGQDSFSRGDQALGYPLSSLCFDGPLQELTATQNAQPAILTHSIALLEEITPLLKERGVGIEQTMGHSVGEYAALVAAKAISFEDAVCAVHLRGKFMREAVPPGQGTMIACLKVSKEKVKEACAQAMDCREGPDDVVMPANFNGPDQVVISGGVAACRRAVAWLKGNDGGGGPPFRSIELNVSAPFHSTLMASAARKLARALETFDFRENKIPYIANVDAQIYPAGTPPQVIKENLVKQVEQSVLWEQSAERLPEGTLCLEVGPGKVLTGLFRKINHNIKVVPLDQLDQKEAVREVEKAIQ